MKVGIIDIGVSNISSITKAVSHLGYDVLPIKNIPLSTISYDRLIFPGVGNFFHVMGHLRKEGIDNFIKEYCEQGGWFLGICMGMQLLFDYGEEGGGIKGLGVIPGRVVKLVPQDLEAIPHNGWNEVNFMRSDPLFLDIPDRADFYFNHSYHINTDPNLILAETPYGSGITSIVRLKNTYGVQFHPEKSQKLGLTLIKNFLQQND